MESLSCHIGWYFEWTVLTVTASGIRVQHSHNLNTQVHCVCLGSHYVSLLHLTKPLKPHCAGAGFICSHFLCDSFFLSIYWMKNVLALWQHARWSFWPLCFHARMNTNRFWTNIMHAFLTHNFKKNLNKPCMRKKLGLLKCVKLWFWINRTEG